MSEKIHFEGKKAEGIKYAVGRAMNRFLESIRETELVPLYRMVGWDDEGVGFLNSEIDSDGTVLSASSKVKHSHLLPFTVVALSACARFLRARVGMNKEGMVTLNVNEVFPQPHPDPPESEAATPLAAGR